MIASGLVAATSSMSMPPCRERTHAQHSRQNGQQSVMAHPEFGAMLDTVVSTVERANAGSVAFKCAYGKHRSVAWACLLQRLRYQRARLVHVRFEKRPVKAAVREVPCVPLGPTK